MNRRGGEERLDEFFVAGVGDTADRHWQRLYHGSADGGSGWLLVSTDVLHGTDRAVGIDVSVRRIVGARDDAGLAALCLSLHSDWTPVQIRGEFQKSAKDLGPPGHDPETGYGLVQLPPFTSQRATAGR